MKLKSYYNPTGTSNITVTAKDGSGKSVTKLVTCTA
jgi:hypothetical protein